MSTKPQIRWALVGYRGQIHTDKIRYARHVVIKDVIAEHRTYSRFNGEGLTDAQFWRQIKRRRNYSIRRISMKVMK